MKSVVKNILLILIVVVFVFANVGCNSSTSKKDIQNNAQNKKIEKKVPTIAVLIPGPVGYFVAVRKGIDKAAKELNVNIKYADAAWDSSKQLDQVEDFVTKKVDMIAICSVDAEAVKPAIKIANDANIPILAFTNAVGSDSSGKYEGLVSYVGQNEVKTGELCGKMAEELLGNKGGNVVMIEGRPGTNPQRNRRQGFMNAIKDQKNIKIVYKQTSNWEKEQAMKIVEDLIQKKLDMNLIFAQDDNSAIGAGTALKEAGLKDKIKVIGLGGSIDGLKAVKDGIIDATTYMSATEEGYKTIETCVKHLKGEKVDPVVQMIQVKVNKDNVDEYKGEW